MTVDRKQLASRGTLAAGTRSLKGALAAPSALAAMPTAGERSGPPFTETVGKAIHVLA